MENAVRKFAKVFLFCGLFFIAGRYVHTYPLPMTPQQQHYLIFFSEKFGVTDYEIFYIGAMVAIDFIVAVIAYSILMNIWRRMCAE
jgi:hypothetical protein